MIPFAHPTVLLLLAFPIALVVVTWTRMAGHSLVVPADHSSASGGRFLRIALKIAACLPAALLAVAILLLAGPQQLGEPKTQRKLTNIQFALDVSGSMTASFGDGDRYDAAMEAINGFIDYREGDAFGLTVFGGHFLHWIRLTSDPSAFRYATEFLGPRRLPHWFSGGTSIGMALEECMKLLVEREEGDRMIILVSDGQSADLYGGRDAQIAADLAANDITVYGIHIAPGSPPAEVATIAGRTGGEIFAAGDPAALDAVFARIDEMQETEIEKVAAESMDHFKPYAIAGGSLLGLLALSLFGLRFTPW